MTLSADVIIDRIALKSKIRKWQIIAIFFAVFATLAIAKPKFSKVADGDYIARITISGIVGDDQQLYDLIDSVADDKAAKAAIVWIDTPGGSAVGGEEIYLRLRELAKNKPVVAVMRSVSASAGYMIALGADYILAREGTITGSIGVLIETAEVTELAQKLGIQPISIKSSPLKSAPSPFEKSTPEAEKVLREMIMDFYNHFIDVTAERRKLPRDKVAALADGRVYSGKKAAETHLVDSIGGEKEAVSWIAKNYGIAESTPISDVEIESKDGFVGKILKDSIGNFWQKSINRLDGISAIWHPTAM